MKLFRLATVAILGMSAVLAAGNAGNAAPKPIRVVVWDERQPEQKQAYDNFLGNAVADFLRARGDARSGRPIEVKSVGLDDPDQGLGGDTLDKCDVLVWWGHRRHNEVKPEVGKAIVERIKSGQLSLVALHAAHFSTPFIEAMNARTTDDALKTLSAAERAKVKITYVQPQRRTYAKTEPVTPSWTKSTAADGTVNLEIKLPSCCFTKVEDHGNPSTLTALAKNHPILKGVPSSFVIPHDEIYDGPFFVPAPDVALLDERWDTGAQFPAASAWNLGKGKVFYFRPGHETYPVFKQPEVQQVIVNAVRWAAKN